MTMTYKFTNDWVQSTAEVQADGSLMEVDGCRLYTTTSPAPWAGPGTVFPTIDAWVSAMSAEAIRRAPHYTGPHYYKLSFQPTTPAEISSVAWVPSKQHFMELRRGDQTKFAKGERRYWLTIRDWVVGGCGVKVVDEEVPEIPAAVPIVEAVANVPEIPAFDVMKFKMGFYAIMEWIRRAVVVEEKATGVIQICDWLLKMKRRPVFVTWLEETPLWYVTMRAAIQALESPTPASTAAVTAFLEKF